MASILNIKINEKVVKNHNCCAIKKKKKKRKKKEEAERRKEKEKKKKKNNQTDMVWFQSNVMNQALNASSEGFVSAC